MATSELKKTKRPSSLKELGRFKYRLLEIIGDESVRSFARKCGLSEGAIRKYISDDGSDPSRKALISIMSVSDVNLLWLATGEGPKEKRKNPMVAEDQEKYHLNKEEFALVPRYNVQASAGGGADIQSEQIVDHLAFKHIWLHEMGLQADRLALITAMGDSMEPTIKNGDLLLVDTRAISAADGIYILKMDGMLLAKRLHKNPIDQSVTVKSDNEIYPPVTAQKEQLGLLEIVGRVVWIGGKI